MALSNRDRVERIMDALQAALGPYIIREYKVAFKRASTNYMQAIEASLGHTSDTLPDEAFYDAESLAEALDTHKLLTLMIRDWFDVFHDKLGHPGRNYVGEMLTARNDWAHQKAFTNDQAYRIADTAQRLLKAISAPEEAAAVENIAKDLLHLRFEAEAKKSREDTGPLMEVTTPEGLKPWREVVSPHPDVAGGRYIQAEFAADLAQVLAGDAAAEYQDPVEFFRRTYLTEGLLTMLVTGIQRLTAKGGDPVVQLQTAFGGGKTHSMLALYHLAGPKLELGDFPGGERIAEEIGNVDMPEANRAVVVGTAFSATHPTGHEDVTRRTLWGEIAYQLGGREGYQLVEEADHRGSNPGSDKLVELFEAFGPCLIIIDELVAYVRNLYGVEGLPAGSYDTVLSFAQSLAEAVRRSTDSMLLVSLPESDIEVGGEAGRETLERLSHILGRIESIWKPVTPRESFEIVRRRLFSSEVDYAARDAVIEAFADLYRNSKSEFPSGVAEKDYLDRMRAAYPIHPELFDRLYEDWSTLERFQRTRGVLRLMASVIHQLWTGGDPSLLIIPGTIPLQTTPVRNELLRYLPDTWAAVMDVDIDGPESRPMKIDENVPALGRYSAARRLARTIFIGSAPSVAGQKIRGLEEVRLNLGCGQPGEPLAIFGDALRRMGGELTYLYSDGTRYWYDTRPTVNKLARDRAQGFKDNVVEVEIIERLKNVPRNRDFAGFHVAPPDTADVVDEDRVRVVVLPRNNTHKRTTAETVAVKRSRQFLQTRGSSQRLYKNMLVFIAPDKNDAEALAEAVRDYLAWQSIEDETEALNLDAQQRRQVADSLKKADETVNLRTRNAYSWLIVPVQSDPMGEIEFQTNRISGDDNFYDRAARKLRSDGLLIDEWSPDILRMELEKYIWGEEKGWQVGFKKLWEFMAQYVYLPRLSDHHVLVEAIKSGVRRMDAPVAYATGENDAGFHTGIAYQSAGDVFFDENSLIIHPEHLNPPPEIEPPPIEPDGGEENGGRDEDEYEEGEREKKAVRYYGRVSIDPQRVNKDVGLIVEEVIERMSSELNCEVEITMEIRANKPDGFDESKIRTVSENSRTLKFDDFGFEEEV